MRRSLSSKFTFFFLIIFLLNNCSDDSVTPPSLIGGAAKVVGYLPSYRFDLNDKIEYCKLTHLNLAFANPDADGNLLMNDVNAIITKARVDNPNIVICISLAGGGAFSDEVRQNWSDLIDIPANRPSFISKIVNYVLQNDLDGVDVDLEWDLVTLGYSDFVIELNVALDAQNKLLTAALPNNTRYTNASDAALAAFDFINIMSYDGTGPWRPEDVGPHSSYQFSKSGINFWKNSVNIPSDKLTLGVPFYGYDFSTDPVTAISYGQLVKNDPALADIDQTGLTFYNGRPTIKTKVEMAANDVGGIMIWELGQDSFDQYSLLNTIHEKFTALGVKTTVRCGNH